MNEVLEVPAVRRAAAAAKVRAAIAANDNRAPASALFRAQRQLVTAEHAVEDLLDEAFGHGPDDWQDFESDENLGTLDVFGVTTRHTAVTPDELVLVGYALGVLAAGGFRNVTLHDHSRDVFVGCCCRRA